MFHCLSRSDTWYIYSNWLSDLVMRFSLLTDIRNSLLERYSISIIKRALTMSTYDVICYWTSSILYITSNANIIREGWRGVSECQIITEHYPYCHLFWITYHGQYGISLSIVSLIVALVSFIMPSKCTFVIRSISSFLFTWTYVGASIRTFGDGPFVKTSNGYFARGIALYSVLWPLTLQVHSLQYLY